MIHGWAGLACDPELNDKYRVRPQRDDQGGIHERHSVNGRPGPLLRHQGLQVIRPDFLMLVYTLNFIDRTLITVVAQPIINEFELSDTQWGLLAGPPLALFYALIDPDRDVGRQGQSRMIISLCIIIWSVMTALCGVASGFIWLLIFRGVAVGEAGCTPPPTPSSPTITRPQRAGALGIYSMGVTIGGVLAQLFMARLPA